MPPRRGNFRRPPPRHNSSRRARASDRIEFVRRAVPMPPAPIVLRPTGPGGDGQDEPTGPWELVCRDGWEWRPSSEQTTEPASGAEQVYVRVATLTSDQATIVQQWIERIRDPAAWWDVSRALQAPESAPNVEEALRAHPWLFHVLPVVLEASTDGAPPPPPSRP